MRQAWITKGHEETFWDDSYVHYIDFGNGFPCIHVFKYIKLYTLFYNIWYMEKNLYNIRVSYEAR